MYIRKKIKKRSFVKKHRIFLFFLFGIGFCLSTFFLANRIRNTKEIMLPARSTQVNSPIAVSSVKPVSNERIVYPYSVISGGVRSREELAARIDNDSVVADHYKNFNLREARIVRAAETRFMHVSYRLKNKVYWTAQKVSIPKGEALITDGNCEARVRCGNQVSASPQEPISAEEPAIESFDLPQLAQSNQMALDPVPVAALELNPVPTAAFEFDSAPPLPVFDPSVSSLRPEILPYYYRPIFVVRPLEPVPEAGTLALLFTGLAALFLARFACKK